MVGVVLVEPGERRPFLGGHPEGGEYASGRLLLTSQDIEAESLLAPQILSGVMSECPVSLNLKDQPITTGIVAPIECNSTTEKVKNSMDENETTPARADNCTTEDDLNDPALTEEKKRKTSDQFEEDDLLSDIDCKLKINDVNVTSSASELKTNQENAAIPDKIMEECGEIKYQTEGNNGFNTKMDLEPKENVDSVDLHKEFDKSSQKLNGSAEFCLRLSVEVVNGENVVVYGAKDNSDTESWITISSETVEAETPFRDRKNGVSDEEVPKKEGETVQQTTPPLSSICDVPHLIDSTSNDFCRICHCEGDDEIGPLIDPCYCRGSLRYVHQACMQQWIKSSDSKHCELCGYHFVMDSKLKPFHKWKKLSMSTSERRKIMCSVMFHIIAITCVIWSLYVLIERTASEIKEGELEWPFWTKLVVVAIGFTGGLVFMYIQCKVYVQLWRRLKAFNRVIYVRNNPPAMPFDDDTVADAQSIRNDNELCNVTTTHNDTNRGNDIVVDIDQEGCDDRRGNNC